VIIVKALFVDLRQHLRQEPPHREGCEVEALLDVIPRDLDQAALAHLQPVLPTVDGAQDVEALVQDLLGQRRPGPHPVDDIGRVPRLDAQIVAGLPDVGKRKVDKGIAFPIFLAENQLEDRNIDPAS